MSTFQRAVDNPEVLTSLILQVPIVLTHKNPQLSHTMAISVNRGDQALNCGTSWAKIPKTIEDTTCRFGHCPTGCKKLSVNVTVNVQGENSMGLQIEVHLTG